MVVEYIDEQRSSSSCTDGQAALLFDYAVRVHFQSHTCLFQPFNPRVSEVASSVSECGHVHRSKHGIGKNKTKNRMTNSVDPDEMAHYEPSHLDLHCLQRFLFCSARLKWFSLLPVCLRCFVSLSKYVNQSAVNCVISIRGHA